MYWVVAQILLAGILQSIGAGFYLISLPIGFIQGSQFLASRDHLDLDLLAENISIKAP